MPFRDPAIAGDRYIRDRLRFGNAGGDDIMVLSGDGLEIHDPDTGDLVAVLGPAAAAQGGTLASLVMRAPTGRLDYQGGSVQVSQTTAGAVESIVTSPTDATMSQPATVHAVAGDGATLPPVVRVPGAVVDLGDARYLMVGSAVYGVSGATPSDPPLPETWHQVGAPGEPAFLAPWANLGGVDLSVRFRRGIQDEVQLAGRAKTTSSVGNNSVIWTMPAAYRPTVRVVLPTVVNNPSIPCVLLIDTTGEVSIRNLPAAVTIASLELTGLGYPLTA